MLSIGIAACVREAQVPPNVFTYAINRGAFASAGVRFIKLTFFSAKFFINFCLFKQVFRFVFGYLVHYFNTCFGSISNEASRTG